MDESAHEPLATAILVTPQTGAGAVFSMLDVLTGVGRDWEMLHGLSPSPPRFVPRLVSVDGAILDAPNGARIAPHAAIADGPRPDILLVPDLLIDPQAELPASYAPLARWIRGAHEAGALVASVCSGAVLLAEAGLLDDAEATTHWAYCEVLARRFPRIEVRRERILVPAGEGHRVITAGGASSWTDLVLYLIARFAGPEEALRAAKLHLLEWHDAGQLPFAALACGLRHDDRVVAECQRRLADSYADARPVAAMAATSGLSPRSLHRRFKRATGQAPIAYVQALRIEEAKQLLETTTMAVDDIAAEVGYEEPASFRRLFRRHVGLSPSDYRRRFQPLFRLARSTARATAAPAFNRAGRASR